MLGELIGWFGDPAHWTGPTGVPQRLLEHLGYTALALACALVIALPIGALVGHTGRGGFLLVGLANGLRALPTLGLLTVVVLLAGVGLLPPIAALTVLAVPPVLAGTYAGVRAVDPAVVDAARGMGMREHQVLLRVELPNALPIIFGGVRSAALQIVATATVAAYVAMGGLGRYVIDGLAQLDYPQVLAGAVLVAALAVVLDAAFAGVQRVVSPAGARRSRRGRAGRVSAVRATEPGGTPG
ncbi:ABC transporter permease [Gandjariella thermophila]|uniref:ABC transporter permease n=1 Tax=Gandjariella thermophila TaxID=1931992 RepID=UPI0010F6C972|nr:ABC transporter permease subunit [Gandjariella thermophila]